MFSGHELFIFTTAAFILAITPGADMLLVSTRTLTQGRIAGFLTMCGIMTGALVTALMVAIGLAAIIAKIPIVYEIIRWAGVCYLLWLAISALKTENNGVQPDFKTTKIPTYRIFIDGMINNILNPKCILFALSIYPQFWHPEHGSVVLQTLVLVLIADLMGLIAMGAVVIATAHFHKVISGNSGFKKFSKYLLASVFGLLALRIATSHKN